MKQLGKYRLTLIIVGLAIVVGASLPAFMSASCVTRQQTPAETRALENLRAVTRGGVLPGEDVVARIETEFPRTRAAALARLVRARIRIKAKDFAGAATLLDTNLVGDHSTLGDYALFMRANALEEAGRLPEARIAYEKLVNDYPESARAREAALKAANITLKAAARPQCPSC